MKKPRSRSFDGVREYKCTSSTLKRKAREILQGRFPSKVEKDAAGKERESSLEIMLNTRKKKKWD